MKIRRVKEDRGDEGWIWFRCPACEHGHTIPTKGPRGWQWNGDLDRPTISPSLKVTTPDPKGGTPLRVCHFYVKNGQIEYLGDCTHALAGKTIPMEDLE